MGEREKLIAAAEEKFEKERLIKLAEAKHAAENAPPAAEEELPLNKRIAGGLRSVAEGMTMGLSEPVLSAYRGYQAHEQYAQEGDGLGDQLSRLADLDHLKKSYDADVEERRNFKKTNPKTAMGGEIVGAIAPMIITGGQSLAAKGLATTGEAVSTATRVIPGATKLLESPGIVGSVARTVEAGTKGAAQALVADTVKNDIEGSTGFIKPEEMAPESEVAKVGAVIGGALHLPGEVVAQTGRLAKKVGRVFGGVKEENIDAYLARPEAIRNAPTVEEVKTQIDDTVAKLREDVDAGKLAKEDAADILKAAQSKVDDLVRENKNIVASQKADIRMKFRDASSDLEQSFKIAKGDAKNARLPLQADDVLDSVEKIKGQVSDLSEESYKILDLHKGTFKFDGVPNQIARIQNSMKVKGQLLSKDAEEAYNLLGKWKEKMQAVASEADGQLTGSEVKQVIQEIDKDLRRTSDKMAGEFSDIAYNKLLEMRKILDSKIKTQVAGYSEIMEETAKLNDLRGQWAKMFGKRESVTSKLANIQNPKSEYERKMLVELGESTGKDFKTPLEEYMNMKNKIRTPVAEDELRRSLPEYQSYVDALAENARAQRPEYGRAMIEKAQTASPEAAAVRTAQQGLDARSVQLDQAKAALAPYKTVTPNNSENMIRTLMGDRTRKIELRKLMTGLGQISDQDFVQIINDMRVRDAFEKGAGQGSANVNVWATMIGGGVGFALGDATLASGGLAAGAAVGRIMDSYGPKITRRVLDGIIYMKGMPTVQKIEQVFADVPTPLREQLKADLIRAVTVGNSTEAVSIPPEERADVVQDIRRSDVLNSVEKAAAINSINKKGAVDSQVMQKVMVGNAKPPSPAQAPVIQQRKGPSLDQVTDFVKQRKQEAY